ncbi:MAG TPA: sodium:proton antiporter [Trueperaceae bacterium]|nr:sodium:proton antiporter [Trueperaceae bacterium]
MTELLASHPGLAVAAIIALGVAAQWLAWRWRVPAILPLLAAGFLVGPVLGVLRPSELFPAEIFFPLVSLAVGLILFEGGLTLRFAEIRETRRVVLNLVTWGGLVTWLGAAVAAHLVAGVDMHLALLFGALVMVTGPTVIGPLLRIVRPVSNVASVLKWEGIVIDAVGALVAVLVYESLLLSRAGEPLGNVVLLLLRFLLVGAVTGAAGGAALAWLLKRRAVPDFLINVVALAALFATFTVADVLSSEAGLLAAVVMGIIVANAGVPNLGALLTFKEDLTVLFVSMLFIVLAANVSQEAVLAALSWETLAVVAIVVLLLRPLDVLLSSLGSKLTWQERAFIAWVGPRGIVAASVTSLLATRLLDEGIAGAEALVPLVFAVIVVSVLLASLTAKPLGVRLGVADPDPQGFLLLGAHPVARHIAKHLADRGLAVLLADTNPANVAAARAEGLPAYHGSLLADGMDDQARLAGIGRLIALTSNEEANALTAVRFRREFGKDNVFQLTPKEHEPSVNRLGGEHRGLWLSQGGLSYDRLQRLYGSGAELVEVPLSDEHTLADFVRTHGDGAVPLFIVQDGQVRVVSEATDPERESAGTLLTFIDPRV